MVSSAIVAFFDLPLIQGWILHRKVLEEDSLCLKNFKLSVNDVLLLAGKVQQKKAVLAKFKLMLNSIERVKEALHTK